MTETEHRIRTALALIKSMPVGAYSEIAILLRNTSDPRLRWYLQPAAAALKGAGGEPSRPEEAERKLQDALQYHRARIAEYTSIPNPLIPRAK
jgi:hypothetical protein